MKTRPLTILIPEPDEDGLCDVTCILLRGDYENNFYFSCKYGEIVEETLCKPSSGCPWYKHAMKNFNQEDTDDGKSSG